MQYRYAVNFGTLSIRALYYKNLTSKTFCSLYKICPQMYLLYVCGILKQMEYRYAVNFGTLSTITSHQDHITIVYILCVQEVVTRFI